jgi:membrane protein DedA with SNARE-associated domain
MIPHLHSTLIAFVAEYGTLAVAAIIFLESFGLPLPGEIMLIAGAGLVSQGLSDPVLFFACTFLAAVIGDNLSYLVGRRFGAVAITRFGARIGLTPERYAWAEEKFQRVGPGIIVVARFIAFLRQLNGLIAGSLKMHWAVFAFYNAIGAALWVGVWETLALLLGKHVRDILRLMHDPGVILGIVLLVLLGGFAAWMWRRARNARAAAAEPGA